MIVFAPFLCNPRHPMSQRICQISLLFLTSIVFIACSESGGSGGYNPDIGPFDEDGNYVEAWADNPPKRGSNRRTTNPKPDLKPAPRVVSRPEPSGRPVTRPRPATPPKIVSKPKPKPKPKPVVVKPKSRRHMVKKGDTLYSLSKRYGTSVSAIKRANGISGTTINTGKSYLIPR